MKLCTFRKQGEVTDRLGLVLENHIVYIDAYFKKFYKEMHGVSNGVPSTIIDVLSQGNKGFDFLRHVLDHVDPMHIQRDGKAILSFEEITLRPPVPEPGIIFTVGANYTTLLAQLGKKREDLTEPVILLKAGRAVIGPGEPIILPPDPSAQINYEAELGVVMGRKARNIHRENAFEYVAGYTVANDILCYNMFRHDRGIVSFAKSFDGFAPIGPYLLTCDEVPDPHHLNLELKVNGVVRQEGNTEDMVFTISEIIEYISRYMTMEPGDMIFTGTPVRSGAVHAGDLIRISIENVGILQNPVQSYPG